MRIDVVELGRAVRQIRKLRGFTQQVVADHAGVSLNYLSMLENGQRGATIETLNSLAEVLSVPTSFLTFLGSSSPEHESPFGDLVATMKEAIIATVAVDAEVT